MSRLELHNELLQFADHLYFQPPSNIVLEYPCIVYNKSNKHRVYADDKLYLRKQAYNLMLIGHGADSSLADEIEEYFEYCTISQYYINDNLHHTTLTLYY